MEATELGTVLWCDMIFADRWWHDDMPHWAEDRWKEKAAEFRFETVVDLDQIGDDLAECFEYILKGGGNKPRLAP